MAKLHTVSTDALVNAGLARAAQKIAPFGFPPPGTLPKINLGWQPVVDGAVLPENPFEKSAPALSAGIPFLSATCSTSSRPASTSRRRIRRRGSKSTAALTPQLSGTHGGGRSTPIARRFRRRSRSRSAGLIGADLFRRGTVLQTERKAAQDGAPVYAYWFGWKTPVLDGRPLAFHCQDLAFWFDNIDLCVQATGGGDDARKLASQMSGALVAFAQHRRSEPRRHPEVGAVHRGQPRDDDLGLDVRGEDRSGSGEARQALVPA